MKPPQLEAPSGATQRSNFERHAQTLLASILVGLVGWVGLTVTQGREETIRLQERVEYLAEQLGELRSKLEQGVSRTELSALRQNLTDHETRLRSLEKRGASID